MQSRSFSDRKTSASGDVCTGEDALRADAQIVTSDDSSLNLPKDDESKTTAGANDGVDDAELLRRFLKQRDEEAFVELVSRYERLVMGVALRQAGDRHRAEDVFQATFLVLAERAAKIRKPDSLASWLHGTARRIGLRAANQQKQRRLMHEQIPSPEVEQEPLDELEKVFQQQMLDDQLAKLPEQLRVPIILHYLEGMTAKEVADRLSLPVTTVEGRLKKGRGELRTQLMKHGVSFGIVLAAFGLSQKLAAAQTATTTLSGATASAAVSWLSQQQLAGCSANAARLASQEIALMTTTKLTTAVLATTAVCLTVGIGGSLAWGQLGAGFGPVPKSSQWVQHNVDSAVADENEERDSQITLHGKSAVGSEPKTRSKTSGSGAPSSYGRADYGGFGDYGTFSGMMGGMSPNPQQILHGSQDYRTLSRSHAKIEKALQEGSLNFPEQFSTLQDLASVLAVEIEAPVVIDTLALTDIGIPEDANIDATNREYMPSLTTEEALQFLLRHVSDAQGSLDYIIRDGVLTITTVDVASEHHDVAIYEVRHLGPNYPPQDVAMLIESMTPEAQWLNIDGDGGTIKIIPGGVVVKQTQQAHREIRGLIKQLEQFAARTDLPPATRDPQTMRLNDDNWVPEGGGGLGGGGFGGMGGGGGGFGDMGGGGFGGMGGGGGGLRGSR